MICISLAGSDLPDDDYTTLVPQTRSINNPNRKIPTIIEDKEHESSLSKNNRKNLLKIVFI